VSRLSWRLAADVMADGGKTMKKYNNNNKMILKIEKSG